MGGAATRADELIARESIARRFNGPPESANGGYACGIVARHIAGPATVTLRMPPPLERDLAVVADGDGGVRLLDGETLVAEGRPGPTPQVEPPRLPTFEQALDARRRHPGIGVRHLLSDCFVCGPERADGLGASPGELAEDPDVGAAPFTARDDLPHASGAIRSEIVWAALDCPSFAPALWRAEKLCLLGRLAAAIHREVAVGERLAAVGWLLGSDGRKHHTASALVGPGGEVVARAQAVWIELRT